MSMDSERIISLINRRVEARGGYVYREIDLDSRRQAEKLAKLIIKKIPDVNIVILDLASDYNDNEDVLRLTQKIGGGYISDEMREELGMDRGGLVLLETKGFAEVLKADSYIRDRYGTFVDSYAG